MDNSKDDPGLERLEFKREAGGAGEELPEAAAGTTGVSGQNGPAGSGGGAGEPLRGWRGLTLTGRVNIGLAALLLIIIGLAVVGYKNLADSSRGMIAYNRLAFLNVGLSDLRTDLYAAAYSAVLYAQNHNRADLDAALDSGLAAAGRLDRLRKYADNPADQASLTDLDQNLDGLRDYLAQMGQAAADSRRLLDNLKEESGLLAEALNSLIQSARSDGNHELVFAAAEIRYYFFTTHIAVLDYLSGQSKEVRGKILEGLEVSGELSAKLGGLLHTPAEHGYFAQMAAALRVFVQDAKELLRHNTGAALSQALANNLLLQLLHASALLNDSVDSRMFEFAENLQAGNRAMQARILVIGVLGVLVGLFLTLLTTLGASRMLNEVSRFAKELSNGNFQARINIPNKGRLGNLVNSLQRIPAVLRDLELYSESLAAEVAGGCFRNRLDARLFPGSFVTLAQAINAVCDSYTEASDNLPMPLLTCDREMRVRFMNKAGRELVGCGASGPDSDCGDASCFGLVVADNQAVSGGERVIYPQGRKMDVQLSAFPLRDKAGNTLGFVGSVMDLTEIRRRELVMFSVAGKAKAIVERLVEAASVLSAKAEYIEAGTENQRQDLQATATAMYQMASAVLEVAQNCELAARKAEDTYARAAQGASMVEQAAEEVEALFAMRGGIESGLEFMEVHSAMVGEIVTHLREVALEAQKISAPALDYLAAHAEGGRGESPERGAEEVRAELEMFRRIAAELGELGRNNLMAAKGVEDNLGTVQGAVRGHIDQVKSLFGRMAASAKLALAAEEALHDIVRLATENSEILGSIALAAEEQSVSTQEIHNSVERLSATADNIAGNVSETTRSVQELANITRDLREIMKTLK